jgi:hypothetical protein
MRQPEGPEPPPEPVPPTEWNPLADQHLDRLEFAIHPRWVLRTLLIVTAILVVLSIAGQVAVYYLPDFPLRDTLANLFDVDNEQNLPTLYSVLMFLVAAFLCGIIAHAHSRADGRHVRYWSALSVVLVLPAIDEFVRLHEQTGSPVRDGLGITGGPLYFAWIIPAAAVVAIFGITMLRFLRQLPLPTRQLLLTAAVCFLGGAIGMEMVGGAYRASHAGKNMAYALITTVEESLEMLGTAILLYALVHYISIVFPETNWLVRVEAID